MAAYRIPGPLGIISLIGKLGVLNAKGAYVPGTLGLTPIDIHRNQVAVRAVEAIQEEAVNPSLRPHPQENQRFSKCGEAITYRELMQGCRHSVFDFELGRSMDVATVDWTRPFRVKSGRWNMIPTTMSADMRRVRDQFIGLLTNSMLPHHISEMLRRTSDSGPAFSEHMAYITADGNCHGLIQGAPNAHSVGPLNIPDGVNVVAEIHTHPPSVMLTPPSLDADFRNNNIQLVAECHNGRLWIAHWGSFTILLGQIVIGHGHDDSGAFFRPVRSTEPSFNMAYRMIDRRQVRIPAPIRHMGPPPSR